MGYCSPGALPCCVLVCRSRVLGVAFDLGHHFLFRPNNMPSWGLFFKNVRREISRIVGGQHCERAHPKGSAHVRSPKDLNFLGVGTIVPETLHRLVASCGTNQSQPQVFLTQREMY